MFVFVAVAGVLSGLPLPFNVSLIGPPDNISETMIKISDNPTTMQMSIVGYLIEAIGMVLLAVLLYTTLKKQNRIIARWAFGLWIVQAAFVAIRQISAFSLLNVSQEFVKAGATDSSNFQTPYFMNPGNLFIVFKWFFIAQEAYCFTTYYLNQNMYQ
jgi:hypothetical protein